MRVLAGHVNICGLLGVYALSHSFAVVMDYISGGELFGIVQNKGYLTEHEAQHCTRHVLEALRCAVQLRACGLRCWRAGDPTSFLTLLPLRRFMHSKNVAHRDVKLENIMIDGNPARLRECTLKLIDFGLSKQLHLPTMLQYSSNNSSRASMDSECTPKSGEATPTRDDGSGGSPKSQWGEPSPVSVLTTGDAFMPLTAFNSPVGASWVLRATKGRRGVTDDTCSSARRHVPLRCA